MVRRRGGPPAERTLLAHVTEMVTISSDREGKILYANPSTQRVSGYTPEEFLALDPFERVHPEDRPRYKEAFELRDLLDTHVPVGVEATLSVADDESAVPSPAEEQAFLVMREAVRNAVAHSGCRCIEVSVDVGETELRGRVEDDGAGFDPHGGEGSWHDDRGDGEPSTGVGLRSIKERTEALGGRLDVSSEPGRGSAVEVRIPLAD